MKILMLVNWKVNKCDKKPIDKQSADYVVNGEDYWFFRYFREKPEVDIIDVAGKGIIDNIERNKLHFHVIQGLKAIPRLNKYDLIISHGMTSGVVVALWRKFFKTKCKHLVFDIGCFNSAAESGKVMKLMQFISKSIDGIIYHTKCQEEYYRKYYSWLADKSKFIRFGTNGEEFSPIKQVDSKEKNKYIICVGYVKRDWETLVNAFESLNTDLTLKIIGKICDEYEGMKSIEQIPYIPINALKSQIYNSAFCVLPLQSFNYSYGQMTLLQQMSLGKCVIASNVPSFEGYTQNGENAILYEAENEKELASKMQWAMDHPLEINEIGSKARSFILDECNEEKMAKGVEDFIARIMSR